MTIRDLLNLSVYSADGGAGAGAGAAGTGAAGAGAGAGAAGDGGDKGAGAGDGGGKTPGGLVAAAAAEGKGTAGDGKPGMGHNSGDPQPFFPEGLPETLRGKSDRETIEKIWSNRPQPPEKAEGYEFKPSPDFVKAHGDLKGDKVLEIGKKVAHAAGLAPTQFQTLVENFYGELAKADLLQPPIDVESEIAKLMPKTGDHLSRRAHAFHRINGVHGWVNGLAASKAITKTEANNLIALTVVADGVSVLEKLAERMGGLGVQGAGGQSPGQGDGVSPEQKRLQAMYPTMFKNAS